MRMCVCTFALLCECLWDVCVSFVFYDCLCRQEVDAGKS